MLDTGTDAERGNAGLPARHRRRGRRHLHAAAGLHPVGRPRPHLRPRQRLERPPRRRRRHQRGRPASPASRPSPAASPAAACCSTSAGRSATDGELPDGFAITTEHLEATIAAQGETARVGRGDLLLVRTGRLGPRHRRGRAGATTPAAPPPGLSFTTADWLHATEIAGIATDTWGFEVRPNEFDVAFQPLHQVAIPQHGPVPRRDVGPRRARRRLRRRRPSTTSGSPPPPCPSPAPSAPRSTRSPSSRSTPMPAVNNVLVVGGGLAGAATAIHLAAGRRRRRPRRDQARRRRPRLRHHAAGQRAARAEGSSASGTRCRRPATPSTSPASARPTRPARVRRRDPRRQDRRPRPARRHGHAPPRAGPHPRSTGPPRSASSCGFGTTFTELTQDDAGVDVTFSDGSTGRYDLVVGADGVRSWTRRALGIDLETQVDRHGHLARLRAPARPASPAPTSTTAARRTSPATAPPARTRSTPTSSRPRRTARRCRPTSSWPR